MPNIVERTSGGNRFVACVITDIYAYIDTVEVFFRYLDKIAYDALRKIARIEPVRHHNRLIGYRAILNQPTKDQLLKLDDLADLHYGIASRFDLALDMQCDNPSALRNAILTKGILKWRRDQPMHEVEGTISWVDFKLRKGRPRRFRNLILYDDRPNKVTGEVDCVHLELRFHRADLVKRQGILTVRDLIELNPRALFAKHVKFTDVAKRYVNNRVRKAHTAMRNSKGREVSASTDHYNAHVHVKAKSLLSRLGLNRSQMVKYRVGAESLRRGSHLELAIPSVLDWCADLRIPPIENIGESEKRA